MWSSALGASGASAFSGACLVSGFSGLLRLNQPARPLAASRTTPSRALMLLFELLLEMQP